MTRKYLQINGIFQSNFPNLIYFRNKQLICFQLLELYEAEHTFFYGIA